MRGTGGRLAAEVLRRWGIDCLFTLSGGHLFPIYDGCVQVGIDLIDTRHEQTAAFAAEGWAKLTRLPGVAALTAGPGVTNGVSAITSAWRNGSPVTVLGGRAPEASWGAGSLQELDHVPIVESVTKHASTAHRADSIPAALHDALVAACTPHRGPTFLDAGLDLLFDETDATLPEVPDPSVIAGPDPDPDAIERVARLLAEAERPVLIAGGDVYWAHAEHPVRDLVESARLPVVVNGLGRGTLPADHELAKTRVRSVALREADLVVVAGTPLDFRLGFGNFGGAAVVHLADTPAGVATHVELAVGAGGDLRRMFSELAQAVERGSRADHEAWIARLTDEERRLREADADAFASDAVPIHPMRVYGELRQHLDRDAIVIGDGGDFVSYAGKYVDTYEPGTFLDPGPYGCLGTGAGYALAAALAHPDRQVVLLLGDGAAGFSLMDFDTLVRFGAPVTAIVGNNGIWGLEKHPMQAVYGYDVAAELRPGTRYDLVVEALGGHGDLVEEPEEIGPAIERAVAADAPALVNILTDPGDAYPRSANLG